MITKAQSARGWQRVVRMYICVCPLPVSFSWLRDGTADCLTPWCGSAQVFPCNFSAVVGVMSCLSAVPEVGKSASSLVDVTWAVPHSPSLCQPAELLQKPYAVFNDPFKNSPPPPRSDNKNF